MTDLSELELDFDHGERMPLRHPKTDEVLTDEDGNEGYIQLLSSEADKPSEVFRKLANRRLKRERKGQVSTIEQVEADNVELLVACTVDWHLVTPDGKAIDLDCTEANARAVYANPKISWIRNQAQEFANDSANFIGS